MAHDELVNRLRRRPIRSEFGHGGGVDDMMAGKFLFLCVIISSSGSHLGTPGR